MSLTRKNIFDYIETKYDIFPEYTFQKFPKYCIFRHPDNQKWFGIMMTISQEKLYENGSGEIDIIDLKIEPELNTILKKKNGFFQAYHMNKKHWISLDLSKIDDFNIVKDLIDDSFNLTS